MSSMGPKDITGISKLLNMDGLDTETLDFDDIENRVKDDRYDSYSSGKHYKNASINIDDSIFEDIVSKYGSSQGGGSADSDLVMSTNTFNNVELIEPKPKSVTYAEPTNTYDYSYGGGYDNDNLQQLTEEKKMNNVISKVVGGFGDDDFNILQDREDDNAAEDLEEIDELIELLKDDNVDTTKYVYNQSMSRSDRKRLKQTLLRKINKLRCATVGKELILSAIEGVESLFDGKKTYFGLRPNIKGFHKSANVRLRRLRYVTADAMSGILGMFDNSWWHLFTDLMPALFLYSRAMSRETDDDATEETKLENSISQLRSLDM